MIVCVYTPPTESFVEMKLYCCAFIFVGLVFLQVSKTNAGMTFFLYNIQRNCLKMY